MKAAFRCLVAALFSTFLAANAHALYYWDANGAVAGAGGPSPSGTWSVSAANWSTTDAGTDAALWGNAGSGGAVFAAGVDATSAYTITVDNSGGQVSAGDMHCDDGAPTLAGGPLALGANGPLFSALPGHVFTINCALQNSATNTVAFRKYKMGTVVLGGTNTLHGDVTIEGGTVTLAGDQRIPATSRLVLTNGDDRGGNDNFIDTPATLNTGGFNQSFGALVLTGPNTQVARTLDFNNGQGTLSFANSSGLPWTTTDNNVNSANPGDIPLIVTNFSITTAKLRFGTTSGGLTAAQLGQIQFADYANLPGVIDSNGFVTPALPVFQSVVVAGASVQVTWTVVPNRAYRIFFRDDFSSSWQFLGDYSTFGNTITAFDTFSPPSRYYRAQVLQ